MSRRRRSISLAIAMALLGSAGCLPSKFTIDLAPGSGEIAATEVLADPGAPRSGATVALIDVTGLISHAPEPGLFTGQNNTVDELVAALDKAETDPNVRAVILRINSPGGTVSASETVYNEAVHFRERSGKPLVASAADVAASGGYYLALSCDRIIAEPSTITGSIGVLMQTFNVSEGMDRLGIAGRAIVSRSNKNLASPFEPEEPEHYAILQSMVDQMYDDFVHRVRERRPALDESSLPTLTDGRVFTGAQALDLGLIDDLGGVREAFTHAKQLAGLSKGRLVKYHADGATVRSAYATASAPGPAPASTGTVHRALDQLLNQRPPAAYYLWAPGLE